MCPPPPSTLFPYTTLFRSDLIESLGWWDTPARPITFSRATQNAFIIAGAILLIAPIVLDRKSTRLNSSHANISYAVFCLKKKRRQSNRRSRHDDEEQREIV